MNIYKVWNFTILHPELQKMHLCIVYKFCPRIRKDGQNDIKPQSHNLVYSVKRSLGAITALATEDRLDIIEEPTD